MQKPKISIIVPAYNEQSCIEDTLKSVRNQTFNDLELIVVDNASTDKTADIARKFTSDVYRLEEKGAAKARNYGAKQANGDYLCFIDADTTISSNLIQEVCNALDKGVKGGKVRVEAKEPNLYRRLFWYADNLVDRMLFYSWGISNICSYTPLVFCRKEDLTKVGGFDENVVATEEIRLLKKLRKLGKLRFIDNAYVETSNRRAEVQGEFYGGFLLPFYHFFFPKSKRMPYSDVRRK